MGVVGRSGAEDAMFIAFDSDNVAFKLFLPLLMSRLRAIAAEVVVG